MKSLLFTGWNIDGFIQPHNYDDDCSGKEITKRGSTGPFSSTASFLPMSKFKESLAKAESDTYKTVGKQTLHAVFVLKVRGTWSSTSISYYPSENKEKQFCAEKRPVNDIQQTGTKDRRLDDDAIGEKAPANPSEDCRIKPNGKSPLEDQYVVKAVPGGKREGSP
ncbi:hypothetical protein RUM44_008116 [Polyplax serrata]|uniref:Uncharacterized protein n=1 Tax=Polyplax serrata TaxID=468196 RepID=A0ABR1BBE8_POLSC